MNMEPGQFVRDIAQDRTGVLMAFHGGRAFLRPLGGGQEWEVLREDVRPLTPREELSARLAVANARSRTHRQ
jgi:hypothetical protein